LQLLPEEGKILATWTAPTYCVILETVSQIHKYRDENKVDKEKGI
jgi:hypothetical protein